jgi:CRP-like cAMP-binding protein
MYNEDDNGPTLKEIYLFSHLASGELEKIRESAKRINLQDGQRLFTRGQLARYFYLVLNGQIKLFRLSPDGDEKIIEIVKPGETFAEAVMFLEKQAYPVYAEALGDTLVYGFDMNVYMKLLQESKKSCFNLMAYMSLRLRKLIDEIDYLSLQNASFRLAYYLLQQMHADASGEPSIHLQTPKSVLASQLSITPETLSRILNNFRKNDFIEVNSNDILIKDIDGLKNLLHNNSHTDN